MMIPIDASRCHFGMHDCVFVMTAFSTHDEPARNPSVGLLRHACERLRVSMWRTAVSHFTNKHRDIPSNAS
jgi:hypothetical protein